MRFRPFSARQLAVLGWWVPGSLHADRDAIICDGAVRSGKTLCMSLSFAMWSMAMFSGRSFALCGRTIPSLRRNLVTPLLDALPSAGIRAEYKISQDLLILTRGRRENRCYLFGGNNEASAALIQGVTLSGVLLDEVALMPRSFVEQALARCSADGSKFWFNCNPESPAHWFYTDWILRRRERSALYLRFSLDDNPSLSPKIRKRYDTLYTGVFRERYVLGRWVRAEGAVYPMFSPQRHCVDMVPHCTRYVISCDYGTVNPASFGLWGESGGVWYRMREYYHDSRRSGIQRTDEEYADALEALAANLPVEAVIVDPSAASFIRCLRSRGRYRVVPARNDVLDGIRTVSGALAADRLRFHRGCKDAIREFSLYRWNLQSDRDAPVKEYDHAMDDIRYFACYALAPRGDGYAALSSGRRNAI